ncbi:SusC/RagA family TonB-linked outer membrane protein [Niastella koreensis]|uniref:TonB-dependent receptor plug n=2 Tax=Niastella koreensis TaxID=354356 RepID=G8TNJ3_NIAKG|nr:SusC/RagA family TonB-linked outer membrane protein [Niastella koreensis]AEV99910.1 TonB-dependent receptor plug [Niastella koreensis GR20-10]OQP51480.1 SusC/RagA family TonB-linked outer membrane protein [Niastella koreensis]
MNLQQTKKFSLSFFLLMLLAAGAFAQARPVTGQVTDIEGKPVPGVTVIVKGTAGNVITDKEGKFKVMATPEQTIEFTHIAYASKEVKVGAHPTIDVMLTKADSQMDDVIVIGYGSQRQRNITGSVASVNLARLGDQPVATVADALRGQVPGLNVQAPGTGMRPGATPTVTVRQQFNWGKDGGSPSPLIVIDDVIQVDPSTGLSSLDRFNMLDLSEVESITVLRDATAAIYGSRASQGAIIIKTKKGKIGAPKISYSGKFETNNAVSFAKTQSAYDYGIFTNRFGRALNWSAEKFFSPAELETMKSLNYDWLDHAWSAANAMQHSVTVSGGAERATYFFGGSYYTQGANLGVNKFNRYSFRAGTDVTVANGLKFSATLGANNSDLHKSFTKLNIGDAYSQGSEQADFSVLQHTPKYIPWSWNVNGKDQWVSPSAGPNQVVSIPSSGKLPNTNYFALLNNGSSTSTQTFNYNANLSLAYDIPFIKGLSVKGVYAIQSTNSKTDQAQLPFILVNNVDGAKQDKHLYNDSTNWSAPTVNNKQSRASFVSSTGTTSQMNFFVNYERTFGDHSISFVASGERAKNTYYDNTLFYNTPGLGVYNGTSVTAGTIDPTLTISHKVESGSLSYLGRLNYAYKSRYLFQFIFRSDASSRFAPKNYWGKFPMASAGWVISDEDWFKDNVGFVNFLKIRGSMGITGNDNVKPWKWLQTYTILPGTGIGFGSNGGQFTNGVTPEVVPNPDIKWDKNVQHNLGLDFSLLKNRLSVNIDKYWNNYSNLLTLMTGALGVPWSVGGGFAEQNYSNANAWGEEITVTWKDRIANKVDYSISMNFGIGDNKTTKYFDQAIKYPADMATRKQVGNSSTNIPVYGLRVWKNTSTGDGILRTDDDINNYWQYLTDNANKSGVAGAAPGYNGISTKAGMKKGMVAYQDIRGAINADGTYGGPNGNIEGSTQDYDLLKKDNRTYGISTNLNFAYKGITLQAQIATSWGGYNTIDWIRNSTSSTAGAIWAQSILANYMYDSTDNPNGKYPNMVNADFGGTSSDAAFWKVPSFRMYVRTMSIGYTLPKNLVKRARLDNARLYLSGNNLWDFYNPYPHHYRNMYDNLTISYPTLRTWALGVNLGF